MGTYFSLCVWGCALYERQSCGKCFCGCFKQTEVSPFEQRQAVAVTTAASYDDWCIAQLAKYLGKEENYRFFKDRSYNYGNVFNKETNFFHPKDKEGKFIEPFDYIFSGGIGARAYFDENNAWTYNWDVRHHIQDLIDLFGGNAPFIERLDQLFVEDMKMAKWQYYALHPDATGVHRDCSWSLAGK